MGERRLINQDGVDEQRVPVARVLAQIALHDADGPGVARPRLFAHSVMPDAFRRPFRSARTFMM